MRKSRRAAQGRRVACGAALASCVGAFLAVRPAGGTTLRPGRYASRTETTMEGEGRSAALPATTDDHCYTAKDLEDYPKMVRGMRERDCETTEPQRSGDRVSWSVHCRSGAKGTWVLTHGSDQFELTIEMASPPRAGGPAVMKIHTTARRTGDCAK